MSAASSTLSKSADPVAGLWGLTLSLTRRSREELADYVLTYANDTELAPSEFYEQVRGELERRRLPGLTLTEVEHAEGGVGSARRRYLRLTRDRVYFDLCAAPFGAAFFFSYRAVVRTPLPLWLKLLLLVMLCLVLGPLAAYGANTS